MIGLLDPLWGYCFPLLTCAFGLVVGLAAGSQMGAQQRLLAPQSKQPPLNYPLLSAAVLESA